MPLKPHLRSLACCAILQLAATLGLPMRPEQIQDLMRALNQPTIARTNPDESDRGDGRSPLPSPPDPATPVPPAH